MTSTDPGRRPFVFAAHWLPGHPGTVPQRTRAGSAGAFLAHVVAARDGIWIGPGTQEHSRTSHFGDLSVHELAAGGDEVAEFEAGHCRLTLAPLYYDSGEAPIFRAEWREAYRTVNRRYARAVADHAADGATVWIFDYHLQLVPAYLRKLRPDLRIGFYFDVPFPAPERFLQQPMRAHVMNGLLGADVIGFQQERFARNFLDLAATFAGRRCSDRQIQVGDRTVSVVTAPMAADTRHLASVAGQLPTSIRADQLRADLGDPRRVLLSIGDLQQHEGIEQRLDAYAHLLADGSLDPLDTVLVHVAASGDVEPRADRDGREHIERQVAQINGVFSRLGHPVVHYVRHDLDEVELAGLYAAADVLLAVPLRQAMTLSAKEYVAARLDDTGAVVLSEFSGAAGDLPEAHVVNPYDLDAVKDAIVKAVAVCDDPSEQMNAMRRRTLAQDGHAWAETFAARIAAAEDHRALD